MKLVNKALHIALSIVNIDVGCYTSKTNYNKNEICYVDYHVTRLQPQWLRWLACGVGAAAYVPPSIYSRFTLLNNWRNTDQAEFRGLISARIQMR